MPPITELSRIEPVYLERLEKQGIFTTGILLEVAETPWRRQYLADHVGASLNEVMTWRDEALMLNLAAFGPLEHRILARAGYRGLEGILRADLETFKERVAKAARELKIDEPSALTMTGWWEQARTLETLPEQEEEPEGDYAAVLLRLVFGAVVGIGGAVVAAALAPGGPAVLSTLVVVALMAVTGFAGRLAAAGIAGFIGVLLGAFVILEALLGRTVLIALPDTPLSHDQGLAFPLGPGAGLVAVLAGWAIAWATTRSSARSTTARRATGRAA